MCVLSFKCITQVYGTTIDNAEDLDLMMPVYNLREYSSYYSETTGTLWFYSQYEETNVTADIGNHNKFRLLKYKTKLLENTEADGVNAILENGTVVVLLNYLRSFWRSLEMPLINGEILFSLQLVKIM